MLCDVRMKNFSPRAVLINLPQMRNTCWVGSEGGGEAKREWRSLVWTHARAAQQWPVNNMGSMSPSGA